MKKIILWTLSLIAFGVLVIFFLMRTPDTNADLMIKKYSSEASLFLDMPSGDRIHYRDEGNPDGTVLVLIHGANSSLQTWETMIEHMKSDHRLISLDLPGHGLTGPDTTRDYTAPALTDSILAVMGKTGVDKGIIVGNSMGGWLTWRSALSHPDRFSGVILIGPSGAPRDEPATLYLGAKLLQTKLGQWLAPKITPRSIVKTSVEATYYNKDLVSADLVDRYWELLRFPGNRVAAADRAKVDRNPEFWNKISDINVPVLVLWGENDSVTPYTLARKFGEKIQNTEIISYENIGHVPMEETPEVVAKDISKWIGANFSGK